MEDDKQATPTIAFNFDMETEILKKFKCAHTIPKTTLDTLDSRRKP